MTNGLQFLVDGEPVYAKREVPTIDLFYPREDGNATELEIGLMDVRAADSILVSYDFERDGWSIKQASTFRWDVNDTICDPDWQEVAFVKAWGREKDDAD